MHISKNQGILVILLLHCTLFSSILPLFTATNDLYVFNPSSDFISVENLVLPIYEGITAELINTDEAFEGLNLMYIWRLNESDLFKRMETSLIITDMRGNLLLEEPTLESPAEFYNATTILCQNQDQESVLWNIATGKIQPLGFFSHHDLEANFENNTIFALEEYYLVSKDFPYAYDAILEYDLDGNLVWQLNTSTFVHGYQWCPFHDYRSSFIPDITHSNTVFYDPSEDVIYLNTRNLNTFYKIDHKTGDIIWALGEYGDFDLYSITGDEKTNLFYHSHALELIDENTFILFDNDYHNQTNPDSLNSRILEIVVNESTMMANVSWVWTSPQEYHSIIYGDADHLPNGNRLGVFGTHWKLNPELGAILVEVNDEGDIVWEIKFINENNIVYGLYNMERFRFSPTISQEHDTLVISGTDSFLTWNAWYNYRAKHDVTGHYEIFVDDVLFESNCIIYDRYWRPVNISYNTNSLSVGTHNVTVLVFDEIGNSASDSLEITVVPSGIIVDTSWLFGITLACSTIGIAAILYRKKQL